MSTVQRPPVWIGHVTLRTRVLDESEAFMKQIGMRTIFRGEEVAVLVTEPGGHRIVVNSTHVPDHSRV